MKLITLAEIGVALLPWLPAAMICAFWSSYFSSQLEMADTLDAARASAAGFREETPLTNSQHHTLSVILIIFGFAFAVGIALIVTAALQQRRRKKDQSNTA